MKKMEARALQAILRRAIADIVKVREKVDADSKEHEDFTTEWNNGTPYEDGYCLTAFFMSDKLQQAEVAANDALGYFAGFPDTWYEKENAPCIRYSSEKPEEMDETRAMQKELADEISELKNKQWEKEANLRMVNEKLKMLYRQWPLH